MSAYVANRGSGSVDSTFSLTWTFTTSGTISSGNKIILAIVLHGSQNSIDSVSGGSLTWTEDSKGSNTDGEVAYLFSADAPSGLASGTTITVVEHTGGDVFERRRYSVLEVNGLATGAPGSTRKSGGSGTSTTPSSGATSASASTGDFAVGVVAWKATSISSDWTVTSGFTKENTVVANGRSMWVEYSDLGGSGTVTSHPTTSLTTIQWGACVAYYPLAVSASFGTANLTGVGDLFASGHGVFSGSADLTGVGAMSVSGFYGSFGSAALTGVGALSASGVASWHGAAALTGVGALYASAGYILIVVVGTDIHVSVSGTWSVADMVDAINADTYASALVVATIPAGDGSDNVTALSTTHLSGGADAGDYVPDDTTFYETVVGTGVTIQTLPDDTPLDFGLNTYYVKLIARDNDGAASPSV